jgi:hypothetical protein
MKFVFFGNSDGESKIEAISIANCRLTEKPIQGGGNIAEKFRRYWHIRRYGNKN